LPQTQVPQEQLERFYQRYFFASRICQKGGDILEIACGGGQGLALLEENYKKIVAGDITLQNVQRVMLAYASKEKIFPLQMDGHSLPFPDETFNAILLFEAIYYFANVNLLLSECKRVLKPEGILMVGSANKEWRDFNPSPYAVTYYSARQLFTLLTSTGFDTTLYTSYTIPNEPDLVSRFLSWLKRTAVNLGLMPKSMKYKALLKKVFIGKMVEFPLQILPGSCTYVEPDKIDPGNYDTQFKVIYAVGRFSSPQQGKRR
jgi:ubiquinone/menaquinone biosynthesis C-methylase UbiE